MRKKVRAKMEDTLTVSFCSSEEDCSGLCVTRRYGEHTGLIKMEVGEQADILYRLLTEQKTKGSFKPIDDNISKGAVIGLIRRSMEQIRENKNGEYTNKELSIDDLEKIMIQKVLELEAKDD
jgi:hypothetical protein